MKNAAQEGRNQSDFSHRLCSAASHEAFVANFYLLIRLMGSRPDWLMKTISLNGVLQLSDHLILFSKSSPPFFFGFGRFGLST
ncbi:hypothetical protein E1A91_D13G165900v1 [Gossypium mustelinum]|uniref:Uncharacterized protein n=1 Tax=Gossypium mustelinum TaxID=34275 RepID=A0A5D2S4P0_GOSMU|nr:hypothetical protein E1A91_D13G165900v1 [Gossypium mustelinum]